MYVGEQCLDNRFTELTKGEFQDLRRRSALNRERMRKTERIAALVAEYPTLALIAYDGHGRNWANVSGFITDIGWKLQRDGQLSPRQIEAVTDAIARCIERAHDVALRENAERDAPPIPPVTAGRQTIEGEILTVKEYQDDYSPYGGLIWKMLIKNAQGQKFWGTIPQHLTVPHLPDRGMKVRLTATVKTTNDPGFGKYSRPAKAEIIG